MNKVRLCMLVLAAVIFAGCQKHSDEWVGFYYSDFYSVDGTPSGELGNCEIAEFATRVDCQKWAEGKISGDSRADYFCGFNCNYDLSCQYACEAIPGSWLTFSDGKISFQYPPDFSSEFITPVDWPPVVELKSEKFACIDGEIHGDFCVVETSEGAAGSTYSTFEYSRAVDDGTLMFTFTIREPQCPNYPEPKMSECAADQANLNLDQIVGKIFASFNFIK